VLHNVFNTVYIYLPFTLGNRRGQHFRSAHVQPCLSVDATCEKLAAQKETKLSDANVEAITVASSEEAPFYNLVRWVDEPKKIFKKGLRCKGTISVEILAIFLRDF